MNLERRKALALYGGAGLAAAAAGAGYAWWKFSPHDVAVDAVDSLWPMKFARPDGSQLEMAGLRGKPLMINFWATWCPPCVEELPLIDGFFRQQSAKGWNVVGLAIDQPSAVRTFLQRTPVTFPIGLAGLGGTDLGKMLGNASGGLPFTVVIGSDGKVHARRMGQVTRSDLDAWSRLS